MVTDFDEWYGSAHWGNEDFREGCRRAWDAALAAAWVPCAERMPEEGVEVLVAVKGKSVAPQVWRGNQWKSSGWVLRREHVTHWMPLPQAPKG